MSGTPASGVQRVLCAVGQLPRLEAGWAQAETCCRVMVLREERCAVVLVEG